MSHIGDFAQLLISLVAAFSAWQAWLAKREASLARKQSEVNTQKIDDVHTSINSRMDQLIVKTELASEAKGAADERSKTTV